MYPFTEQCGSAIFVYVIAWPLCNWRNRIEKIFLLILLKKSQKKSSRIHKITGFCNVYQVLQNILRFKTSTRWLHSLKPPAIFVDMLTWRHFTLSLCKWGGRVTKYSFIPSKKKSSRNRKIDGFLYCYEVLQHILLLKNSPNIIDLVNSPQHC